MFANNTINSWKPLENSGDELFDFSDIRGVNPHALKYIILALAARMPLLILHGVGDGSDMLKRRIPILGVRPSGTFGGVYRWEKDTHIGDVADDDMVVIPNFNEFIELGRGWWLRRWTQGPVDPKESKPQVVMFSEMGLVSGEVTALIDHPCIMALPMSSILPLRPPVGRIAENPWVTPRSESIRNDVVRIRKDMLMQLGSLPVDVPQLLAFNGEEPQ